MPYDHRIPTGSSPLAVSRRALLGRLALGGLALGTTLLPWRTAPAQTGAAPSGPLVRQPPQGEFVIRGGYVLTMEPGAADLPRGDVHVRDGTIVEIGENLAAPGAEAIDGAGFIVSPGLVDTHWHMWTSLMRNMADSVPGNGYFQVVTRTGSAFLPEHMYAGTLLSAAEAINAGITTVHDWCHNIRSPEHARSDVQALKDAGIRGRFSYGPYRPLSPRQPLDVADFMRLHDQWQDYENGGLLSLGLGWRGIQSVVQEPGGAAKLTPVDPAVYRADFDAARERGLPVSLHANSTPGDHGHIAALERLGLLHEGFQVVHATHITPAEVEAMARRGAVVTLSPFSEMTIGYGVPPVRAFLEAGVTTGLSVDTTPLTGDADMMDIMKVTHNLFNGQALSEFGTTARRMLELGTLEGARSLGLSAITGSLAAGKRADLIMTATHVRSGGFSMTPIADMAHMIVHSAGPGDVDTVIVDGRVLKRGGRLTAIDTSEVKRRAAAASDFVRSAAPG
jgi:cytosine/adenosine deaminase-related metal-dependent hydrolase